MSDKPDSHEKPETGGHDPSGDHPVKPEIITATYRTDLKVLLALLAIILLPLLIFLLTVDSFVVHLLGLAGLLWFVPFLVEGLFTRSVELRQDRIIKRWLLLGETVVPARCAVMSVDQKVIRFFHGSRDNVRERITIRRFMITKPTADKILAHAEKVFHITKKQQKATDGAKYLAVDSDTVNGAKVNYQTLSQFNKAVASHKLALIIFVFASIVVFFSVAIPDSFDGFAPGLSAFQLVVGGGLLAVALYFLLGMLNRPPLPVSSGERDAAAKPFRLKKLKNAASWSTVITSLVAVMALVVFMLKGNLVDFYLFMGIAIFYYRDFFPQLSFWEQTAGELRTGPVSIEAIPVPMPAAARRRSLQVSLVLVGALAVSSYGESQHYLYKSKKDCLDDWGSEQECKEPPAGSGYYRSRYYFGPRYGSYQTGRPTHSVGSVAVSRGGFGSLGGFHASFGG